MQEKIDFFLQTLTAAMAAANSGAAAGAAPAMNPYTQAPFMTVLPTHQHSQIHLHLPQHGDAGTTVGSQRSQVRPVKVRLPTRFT